MSDLIQALRERVSFAIALSPASQAGQTCPVTDSVMADVTPLVERVERQRDEARLDAAELRGQVDALTRACVELARQRDAALAGRPVSALDDGRRLVRIEDGDREAMAEGLVEAFVDGDPETRQTIVDKLGEQSEH